MGEVTFASLPASWVVACAALLGLVIGSFLNVVVYRVPAGKSLIPDSACPHCGAPIRPWQNIPVISWIILRGKCHNCHVPISARYPLVEMGTAVAFAVIAAWAWLTLTGPLWADVTLVVACLYLVAISIALALIDIDTKRLPDVIVLPSYVVGFALFALAAWLGGDWWALARAVIGMIALWLFYFVLMLIRPDGMGAGDVKLAGVLGLWLGWFGWGTLVVGALAAFILGGLFGLGAMLLGRAGRKTQLPFGPWMLGGAWVGIFLGMYVATAYLRLAGIQ